MKRFFVVVILLTPMASPTFGQPVVSLESLLAASHATEREERAKKVLQDNEYITTGKEKGKFLSNPLMLNGAPLDLADFNLTSNGELTVNKQKSTSTETMQVPFFVYLRRNGNKVLIPGKEKPDPNQMKADLAEILSYAEPGDLIIIEAVRQEDGLVKRILKIIVPGC